MNHCLLFAIVDPMIMPSRTGGVYRIATHLRSIGWDVEVIDFGHAWSLEELKLLALSRVNSNTKFFGFSHKFSSWDTKFEKFIEWSRTKWDLKYISGSSVNPLFNSKQIDYYVQGFGENAITHLLKYLFSNGEQPRFWLNTGRKIINANADYPSYPMDDLSNIYEKRDFILEDEWLNVEFARGCMFACDFCNFPLIGLKGDMTRSTETFREEMIRNYDSWGTKNYTVADETFNDRPSKIKKFADVVETLPFEPFYTGFVRADLLVSRKQDRIDMARMNFRGHYYGVESFNTKSARIVGKGMDSDRLKQGLIDVRKYFETTGNGLYRGTIGLIVGLPYETKETMAKTRQWLLDNWNGQSFAVNPLTIPSLELENKSKMFDLEKYGYTKLDKPYKADSLVHSLFDEGVPWQNENMNIIDAYNIAFDMFYNKEFAETGNFKTCNYEMSSYVFRGDVKDRLGRMSSKMLTALSRNDNSYMTKQFMFDVHRESFLTNYKQRKLSL